MGLSIEHSHHPESRNPLEVVDFRGVTHKIQPNPELLPLPLSASATIADINFGTCHYTGPVMNSLYSPLNLNQPLSTATLHILLPGEAQTMVGGDGTTALMPFEYEPHTGSETRGTRLIPRTLAFSLHNNWNVIAAPRGSHAALQTSGEYTALLPSDYAHQRDKSAAVCLSPAVAYGENHSLLHIEVVTALNLEPENNIILTGKLHLLALEPTPVRDFEQQEFIERVGSSLQALNRVLDASLGFGSELCPEVPQRGYLSMGHNGN